MTHVSLTVASSVGLASFALAQGGTLVTETEYLGFLGYAGYFGDEIATLDDGTGRHDLLVAQPTYYNHVFLHDGLDGSFDFKLDNPGTFATGAKFGRSVDGVGDLDSDGLEDFAVGAPGNPNGGAVYLYRRVAGSTPQLWLELGAPAPDRWEFGAAVAGIEDVDGDGVGEVLVGQPGHTYSSIPYPGYAYLFSGANGTILHTFSSSGGATSTIGFGQSVASVPDVDGDGLSDLAVGAGSVFATTSPAPKSVRIYGSVSGAEIQSILPFFTSGNGTWAREIAGLEDMDGDGRGEVLVGDPDHNRAFVYSALTGDLLFTLVPPFAEPGMLFGFSVDAGGDVDGDGVRDLLIGAPYANDGTPYDKGLVFLFSGSNGTLLRTYRTPVDYQPGFDWHEYFGRSVKISPDSNGDGRADVVIGAPGIDIPDTGNGATFTFFCLDEQEASASTRLGSPPNSDALVTQDTPLIGGTFEAAIDHTSFVPGSLLDVAILSTAPTNVPTPEGTLLVDLSKILTLELSLPGAGEFATPLPSHCALVGVPLFLQGASWDGGLFHATNALDLVVGSF